MSKVAVCAKCGEPCSATDKVESWWLESTEYGGAIHIVCLPDRQQEYVLDQIMAINLIEMIDDSTKYVN